MNELNSRMKRIGERFCEPEDRTREITNMNNSGKLKGKKEKKKRERTGTCMTNKRSVCVIREPEWEEEKCKAEKLFKKHLK